jgi:5-methylcytosine-specific restriction endonuclease McrA
VVAEWQCRRAAKERACVVDGWPRCERCGSVTEDLSLHHRRKRSQLPKDRLWELSNCVILCGDGVRGCHGWVEHNPDAAREEGFHVRAFEEARQVPIKLWYIEEMVYLNDQGGIDLRAPEVDND